MAPHASSVTLKGQHYARTLDLARRLSLTAASYPAVGKGDVNYAAVGQGVADHHSGAPPPSSQGGTALGSNARAPPPQQPGAMDWNELLRKFNKHNPARHLTSASASLDVLLHHLLSQSTLLVTPFRSSKLSLKSQLASAPSFTLPPLAPLISAAGVPEAKTAIEQLQQALDSYAGESTREEVDSARVVLALGKYAVDDQEAALRLLGEMQSREVGQNEGGEGYNVVLKVVAAATEAFALERLSRPSSELLSAYSRAADTYSSAVSLLSSRDPVGGANKNDIELHRVGGEALFRACLLSREHGSLGDSLSLHQLYLRLSSSYLSSFPPSSPRIPLAFPSVHRLTIYRSLRSLLSSPSSSPSLTPSDLATLAAHNNRAQERLVRETTSVPKAGETNAGYLRFLDEVVEGWRSRGAPKSEAGEVVEILYSALSHTIQSHLLLRHLLHALTVSSRYAEAAKVLRLYRAYGDKTRETDAKAVAGEMRRLKEKSERGELEDQHSVDQEAGGKGEGEKEKEKDAEDEKDKAQEKKEEQDKKEKDLHALPSDLYALDLDSDATFIHTLVFGVRLLVKHLDEPKEAREVAKRAREVWEKSGEKGLKQEREVEGEVEWAVGVAEGALASQEHSPSRRSTLQSSSLTHLDRAASLSPSSFPAHFSLAHHLLTLRLVNRAISAAKAAVSLARRGTTQRKEAWLLLALAVSAGKDMRGALEVLETALDEDEDDVEDVKQAQLKLDPAEEEKEKDDRWLSPSDAMAALAAQMQLRLTKSAVVEYLEGAPATLVEHQETLSFFAREVAALASSGEYSSNTVNAEPAPSVRVASPSTAAPSIRAQEAIAQAGVDVEAAKPHRATSILGRRRSSKKHPKEQKEQQAESVAGGESLRVPPSVAPSLTVTATGTGSVGNLSLTATSAAGSPSASSPALSSRSPPAPSSSSQQPVDAALHLALERSPSLRGVLAQAWLAGAASFRRAGRLEEARGAVGEADALLGWSEGREERRETAGVWSQLALIHLASSPSDLTPAREALNKALSFDPQHVPSLILLARLYLTPSPPAPSSSSQGATPPPPPSHLTSPVPPLAASSSGAGAGGGQDPSSYLHLTLPLAETLLHSLTSSSSSGASSPEAWFELSRCHKLSNSGGQKERKDKERECLVKALGLEETRPVRELDGVVGRVV